MISELEYLDHLDEQVQRIFDLAIAARNEAQAAIRAAQAVKADLLYRKIELQRAQLAETATTPEV